ncbi:MAG: sigma-70 family RNA polymerase sigma factor [Firmicutes bacterium]|nr:sigma-70 family RNA polymerase sigma factor [Candidatus Fermentithermobacillaceae bacterium]
MALQNEEALVERASRGDLSAFEALVRAYETKLYNVALRMVSDSEDAMDIVQEVFLKAHQALPGFRGDSKFSTWIYRICMNASLDHLRRRKKAQVYSLDAPVEFSDSEVQRQVEDPVDSTEDLVEAKFLGEKLFAILDDLEPHYRAVLILCDVQGYSYQEIAEILDTSLGTVKSRIHRARNILRKLIAAEQILPSYVKQDGRRDEA